MRAAVLWTISDFPAYGMLSGWSTHGRLACPYCMERSKAFYLDKVQNVAFLFVIDNSYLLTTLTGSKKINF